MGHVTEVHVRPMSRIWRLHEFHPSVWRNSPQVQDNSRKHHPHRKHRTREPSQCRLHKTRSRSGAITTCTQPHLSNPPTAAPMAPSAFATHWQRLCHIKASAANIYSTVAVGIISGIHTSVAPGSHWGTISAPSRISPTPHSLDPPRRNNHPQPSRLVAVASMVRCQSSSQLT